MKSALLYVPDLFFAPRLVDALKHLGIAAGDWNPRDPGPGLQGASLVVVQLDGPQKTWLDLIRRAHEAGVPVLAFGRHTDAAALRAARHAGADKAVPNSELVASLPQLVEQLGVTRS